MKRGRPLYERQKTEERKRDVPEDVTGEKVTNTIRSAFQRETRLGSAARSLTMALDAGTLTLEGEVPSVAAKKLALEIAARHTMVDAIVDRVHIRPLREKSDKDIRTELGEVFAHEPALEGIAVRVAKLTTEGLAIEGTARGEIVIEVEDGIATLNGRTPGLVSKRLAGAMVWWVEGVRDVINGLAVEPPEEDAPIRIEEAVRCVLDCDPAVEASQIRVGVRGRDVRLTGFVPSVDMRDRAERDAWSVLGVDTVVNEVEVGRNA